MVYTAATQLPTLAIFQWQSENDPNPSIQAPLTADASDNVVYFSSAPLDKDGNVITDPFLIGVRNQDSLVEGIYCPNGADGDSGLSATGCIRGIRFHGLDYTTSGGANYIFQADEGSPVFCHVSAVYHLIMQGVVQGSIATGGTGLIIGDGTNTNATISHKDAAGTKGFLRKNPTTGKAEYSNDGAVWNSIDNVVAGSLVVVSADDTTPSNLEGKVVDDPNGSLTWATLNDGGNETYQPTVNGLLGDIISDVTATSTEINQALDGISANVTDTNLNTLTAGAASNADALHTHSNIGTIEIETAEAIDGSATPKAVVMLGTDYKWNVLIGGTTSSGAAIREADGAPAYFGDADASTRRAQSFVITDTEFDSFSVSSVQVHIFKVSTPTDNVTIEIQADDGTGRPDGVTVANGTSDAIAGGAISGNKMLKFTWSAAQTLTSGQKYWLVFKRSGANDAAKYYGILTAGGSTYGNGGSSTYTASTTSWSAEATADYQMQIFGTLNYGATVAASDIDATFPRVNFLNFTESNVAADANVQISQNTIIGGFAGLTPGAPQYLSTTAGGISETPGNPSVRIGRAISATQIKLEGPAKTYTRFNDDTWWISGNGSNTFDWFIPSGFTPDYVRMRFVYTDVSSTTTDYGMAEFLNTTDVNGLLMTDLNNNSQVVTAQSIWKTTSGGTPLSVSALYDNGFDVRISAAETDDTIDEIQITAFQF